MIWTKHSYSFEGRTGFASASIDPAGLQRRRSSRCWSEVSRTSRVRLKLGNRFDRTAPANAVLFRMLEVQHDES